jgi:cell wall-associated NlpC family hydrolase
MIIRIVFVILSMAVIMAVIFPGCPDMLSKGYLPTGQAPDSSITVLSDHTNVELSKHTVELLQDNTTFPDNTIHTGNTRPEVLVEYAKTLLGTPYLYASADPSAGFDCSGFITYVFQHFNIKVPRSSIDFTNEGKEVFLENSKPGDLILFTGTDSTQGYVGHMGIIVNKSGEGVHFIHSTSGKAKGVVITPFENYYKSRFVKVIRVFPEAFF